MYTNNIYKLHPRFTKSIQYAKEQITASELSSRIISVVLYGSCARGETHFDSDVDILLIVSDEMIKNHDIIREYRKLRSLLHDTMDSAEIDLRLMTKTSWDANDSIFTENIHKEGVEI